MSGKAGGKAKPLKKPKKSSEELDDEGNSNKLTWVQNVQKKWACFELCGNGMCLRRQAILATKERGSSCLEGLERKGKIRCISGFHPA